MIPFANGIISTTGINKLIPYVKMILYRYNDNRNLICLPSKKNVNAN